MAMQEFFPAGNERSFGAIAALTAEEVATKLGFCGVGEQDRAEVAAQWEKFKSEADLVELLAAIDTWLEVNLGKPQPDFPIWDDLFERGASGRYLYLYAAAMGVDRVSKYFHSIGVSQVVISATLQVVPRHLTIYKKKWNHIGTDAGWWQLLTLRGVLLQCGSLQFHRLELGSSILAPHPWYDEAKAQELGPGFQPGDEIFGIHIPQGTDLSPSAVDQSLNSARVLLESIWPSEKQRLFTLQSWLLDPQLRKFLKPESNIVRLQNRFTLLEGAPIADEDTLEFVFRRPGVALEDLPRNSSLERAVLSVLESGGHWHAVAGWSNEH